MIIAPIVSQSVTDAPTSTEWKIWIPPGLWYSEADAALITGPTFFQKLIFDELIKINDSFEMEYIFKTKLFNKENEVNVFARLLLVVFFPLEFFFSHFLVID
jgi:hypothetical protein